MIDLKPGISIYTYYPFTIAIAFLKFFKAEEVHMILLWYCNIAEQGITKAPHPIEQLAMQDQ